MAQGAMRDIDPERIEAPTLLGELAHATDADGYREVLPLVLGASKGDGGNPGQSEDRADIEPREDRHFQCQAVTPLSGDAGLGYSEFQQTANAKGPYVPSQELQANMEQPKVTEYGNNSGFNH